MKITITGRDFAVKATSFAPFGANSILIRDAYDTPYQGPADARDMIIPAPTGREIIEITND